ncbi:alpha/beta hydrolase, partial [Nocardioides sp. GCM10030258]
WEAEIEARSACPVHRRVIAEDSGFARGALNRPLPWSSIELTAPRKPVLVLHGSSDPVTSSDEALSLYDGVPEVRARLVNGGRHDILNDASHRSVAATIVLFLESLKLGPELPDIVSAPVASGVR